MGTSSSPPTAGTTPSPSSPWAGNAQLKGFIPAGWFPGAVATDGGHLFIANIKGDARTLSKPGYWNTLAHRGTVSKVDLPSDSELAKYTHQAVDDAMVPQALQAFEKAQSQAKPVPVPIHAGEPSLFEHVVYVIKENRTYDQLLGDLKQANGDPNLCIYGRNVTPNHHALAEQFVILDNYYCNGVVSADGHQWATQGITSDYVEKSFGGWRSYFFGTDPMAFAPTPFIWDSALLHGLSFRNYGEFAWSGLSPASATWIDAYTRKASFKQSMSLAPARTIHRHEVRRLEPQDLRPTANRSFHRGVPAVREKRQMARPVWSTCRRTTPPA